MKDAPEIKAVDRVDNSVVVEFEGDKDPTIYPADFLHAAKGVVTLMSEQNEPEKAHKTRHPLFLVLAKEKSND